MSRDPSEAQREPHSALGITHISPFVDCMQRGEEGVAGAEHAAERPHKRGVWRASSASVALALLSLDRSLSAKPTESFIEAGILMETMATILSLPLSVAVCALMIAQGVFVEDASLRELDSDYRLLLIVSTSLAAKYVFDESVNISDFQGACDDFPPESLKQAERVVLRLLESQEGFFKDFELRLHTFRGAMLQALLPRTDVHHLVRYRPPADASSYIRALVFASSSDAAASHRDGLLRVSPCGHVDARHNLDEATALLDASHNLLLLDLELDPAAADIAPAVAHLVRRAASVRSQDCSVFEGPQRSSS